MFLRVIAVSWMSLGVERESGDRKIVEGWKEDPGIKAYLASKRYVAKASRSKSAL